MLPKELIKNQSSLESILIIFHKANLSVCPHLSATFLPHSPSIKSLQFRRANKTRATSARHDSISRRPWRGCSPCAAERGTTMPRCVLPPAGSGVRNPKGFLCAPKQIKRAGDSFSSDSKDKWPTQLHSKIKCQKLEVKCQHFQLLLKLVLKVPSTQYNFFFLKEEIIMNFPSFQNTQNDSV